MQDDKEDPKFEQWLKQHATSYNTPPTPDVERMWVAIEADHFDSNTLTHAHTLRATPIVKPTPWWSNSWMRVAAALVVGVGLGRISAVTPSITGAGTNSPAVAAVNASNSSSNAELESPSTNLRLHATSAKPSRCLHRCKPMRAVPPVTRCTKSTRLICS